MKTIEDIKDYWDERAASHKESPSATTSDIYLREIEVSTCISVLEKAHEAGARTVADVGCGNGYSTLKLAKQFPSMEFHGFDYSEAMIENAKQGKAIQGVQNVDFAVHDVLSGPLDKGFDLICTDRCLINLPSWELQQAGISNLHASLNQNGMYLMIENFIEGHNSFNGVRQAFGLPEIAVRDHNLFFEREPFENWAEGLFDIIERENISSTYYLVSRVIYSAICQKEGTEPDYLDDHHALGCKLPHLGDFGPIVMHLLRKK